MLELAVLGLLHETPMHGYELRKRLGLRLGGCRVVSYGSLYPALRRLVRAGLIAEEPGTNDRRRIRRVYRVTDAGRARFAELIRDAGPQACDDDGFGVHLAFFAWAPAEARLRILEGRVRTLERRRVGLRAALDGTVGDRYTRELHLMGLDANDREVRWLGELIASERASCARTAASTERPDDAVTNDEERS